MIIFFIKIGLSLGLAKANLDPSLTAQTLGISYESDVGEGRQTWDPNTGSVTENGDEDFREAGNLGAYHWCDQRVQGRINTLYLARFESLYMSHILLIIDTEFYPVRPIGEMF